MFHHDVVASRRRPVHAVTYYYYYIGIYAHIIYCSEISFEATSIFHRSFVGAKVITGYKKENDGTKLRTHGGGGSNIYNYRRNYYTMCTWEYKNREMTSGDEIAGLCRRAVGDTRTLYTRIIIMTCVTLCMLYYNVVYCACGSHLVNSRYSPATIAVFPFIDFRVTGGIQYITMAVYTRARVYMYDA